MRQEGGERSEHARFKKKTPFYSFLGVNRNNSEFSPILKKCLSQNFEGL